MLLITQIVMTVRFGRKKTRQNVIVISKYALEEFVICCINELSKICVLRSTQTASNTTTQKGLQVMSGYVYGDRITTTCLIYSMLLDKLNKL